MQSVFSWQQLDIAELLEHWLKLFLGGRWLTDVENTNESHFVFVFLSTKKKSVINGIICTYCDVQQFTCQKFNNVLTFLQGTNIGKHNSPHTWCYLCNNWMGAFIYLITSLYKLTYNKALTAIWSVCETHFVMVFYHFLDKLSYAVKRFLPVFLQPYQHT